MVPQDATQPFHWHYGELDDKSFQVHGRSLLTIIVVFALLFFFTLLCLFARWVCRYRRPAAVRSGSDRQSPSAGARQSTTLVGGLDRDTINSFPVHLRGSSAADEAQCSICLSNLVEGEKVKVLPSCDHAFHPECVDEWLRGQSSCPLCRASLAAVDPAS